MTDAEAASLMHAEVRVLRAREIVARQAEVIAHSELSGRIASEQRSLLRSFEGSLAAFEDHLALLSKPRPWPLPARA